MSWNAHTTYYFSDEHLFLVMLLRGLLVPQSPAMTVSQEELLALVEQRWRQAAAGPLQPRILAHREQGRLLLDLHGFSAWTGQLAVLHTLDTLLHQWQLQMPGRLELELGQGQGQGQRQRQRRRDLGGPGYCGWLGGGVPRLHIITGRGNRRQEEERDTVCTAIL